MREETLRMEWVTYREQGVTQLENLNMTVWAGEIMGLVPVNHHGLSALVKLLRQNLPLHYGYVYYREKLVNHWHYSTMTMNRISVIQNLSRLAEGLTVADNIFVLRPGFRKRIMQPKVLQSQLAPFLEDIGMEISSDEYIDNLSTFERCVVELLKAVVAGNHLVVLDDISTFISDAELVKLHSILKHYAERGMSFLYIDPHFEEARQICHRTALMTNGQITKCFQTSREVKDTLFFPCTEDFDRHVRAEIAKKPKASQAADQSNMVFKTVDLCQGKVKNLDLSVAQGECLVLQDLDNSIFRDFLTVLSGEERQESGKIMIDRQLFYNKPDRRIAVIQELPLKTMLFNNMSYLDNLCFTLDHRLTSVWSSNRIKNSLRQEYSQILGEHVFDMPIQDLTETEKYDLIYTRILIQNPKVVFCVQPFKSAEVSLRFHIWELLKKFLDKGIAVVILAVNLADSLALADRLIRIQKNEEPMEYDKTEFGMLPVNTPWLFLYQEKEEG